MMKKRILSVALCAVMCLSAVLLTGCHGAMEKKAFTTPDTFDESKNYSIVFWAKNDTNKKQVDIYNKAISDFESLYPNISITVKFYTDYSRIYNDVITNISTNTTPNVCITYPDNIATYMTGENVVVPLDDLMTDSRYGLGGSALKFDSPKKSEMVQKFLDECYLNGHYYAMPYMRSTEACYVNKTYVEKLGFELPQMLTWDFIWEVSKAAMEKNADGTYAINNQNVLIPFIYKSTDNMMISYLKQKNAGYSTASGDIEIFNDETFSLLYDVAEHAKEGTFSTFAISGYPGNFLNAGQCIFAVDSTAGATWMGSKAPLMDIAEENIVDFETAVLPIPQVDPQNPKMISQGPSVCIFNKEDSGEVMASWLFVQYLLSNEVQISYSKTEGYVPVTLKAQNATEYQEYLAAAGTDNNEHYDVKLQAASLLTTHVNDTFTTPVFNGSASLRSAAGQLIEMTVKGVRKKKDIDEAFMSDLQERMISLYRLDQINVTTSGKQKMESLPSTSVALLVILGVAWTGIITFFVIGKLRKKS